jgi:hypothetical protein
MFENLQPKKASNFDRRSLSTEMPAAPPRHARGGGAALRSERSGGQMQNKKSGGVALSVWLSSSDMLLPLSLPLPLPLHSSLPPRPKFNATLSVHPAS